MRTKIPQFKPYLDDKEYESIKECFDNNWITEGPKSKEFVEALCNLIGVKYGVLAPNGTLSLYMALKSIGIGYGDEVIVPNFTFIASANAIEMCGAKPIFVDIKEDLHIDINKCEKLLTRRTKAIMPVHIYGMSCNMDQIVEFANKNNLKIVEDAAQAIGVTWKGKHSGTHGDVGSFSFFADKTITTGEGGLVVTNDEKIYEKLLYLRNQGRTDRGSFIHPKIGYNFRMTDIQSAIGLSQLKKLPEIINSKMNILLTYKKYLKNTINILEPPKKSNHIPFRVCITIPGGSEYLMKILSDNNIETRTFFYPLSDQPCYALKKNRIKNFFYKFFKIKDNFEISKKMYNEGICLPSFVGISESEIKYICDKINENV
jgi:perosamine synthetase